MNSEGPSPSCKVHGKGRNLVVCIDGTSNQFGGKNTNVIQLYYLLAKDDSQLTYYNSGIGTYAEPSWKSLSFWKQVIENKIDLAIAWNLEAIIIKAYRWLAEHYKPGDRIFLIGFSRGAYQVRAISAMIHMLGLIHKGNEDQIPFAYELYARSEVNKTAEIDGITTRSRAENFKKTFSRPVQVHFVGVWDTVSSVGIFRNKTLPGTTSGMDHVCHFRHALALDERRVKFLPEYACGSTTLKPDRMALMSHRGDENSTGHSDDHKKHTKEVWFAGSHSNIGGGNAINEQLDRSGPPLMWMLGEAVECGLLVGTDTTAWHWESNDKIHESLTGVWWLLEYLPLKRLAYDPPPPGDIPKPREKPLSTVYLYVVLYWIIGDSLLRYLPWPPVRWVATALLLVTCPSLADALKSHPQEALAYSPNYGRGRRVQPGQLIHHSVLSPKNYTPKATLSSTDWADFFARKCPDLEEHDHFGITELLIRQFKEITSLFTNRTQLNELADSLMTAALSPVGRWTMSLIPNTASPIVEVIKELHEDPETATKLTEMLLQVFNEELSRQNAITLLPVVLHIFCNSSRERRRMKVCIDKLLRIADYPRPYSFSSLFSGEFSLDEIGLLCDTGEFAMIYTGSTVKSLTYTPDGKHIISGSEDNTVRVWDAETGLSVLEPLTGHENHVACVAVSPDGNLIASASYDRTVRVWNIQAGFNLQNTFVGHTDGVISVTFSPDSKYVVSGSLDKTVRIWEVATGLNTMKPLRGHTDHIESVAVSPDGQLIASASGDYTVRIWDFKTGASVGEPLRGHTGVVCSVTFTPDGEHIVSGSDDQTIRVWSVKTGETIVGPLRGHTGNMDSIAVSPGGKCIVSGSQDKSVRIWDLTTGDSVGEALEEHTAGVWCVAFSPDGEYIVSGSRNGCIRRWRFGAVFPEDFGHS